MNCSLCNREIAGKYYVDGLGNCICSDHYENKEVGHCNSCGAFTLLAKDRILPDGRLLCAKCFSLSVRAEQVPMIKRQVLYFLSDEGVVFRNPKLDDVSIDIVSAAEIANFRNSPISLANKGITITTSSTNMLNFMLGCTLNMKHKVYILDHLIKIEFAATMAHEFLHIWQNENDVKLDARRCEGLCNVGSWIIYNKFASSNSQNMLNNLLNNPDPIYGDGFRYVYQRYTEIGMDNVLNMAKSGKL